MKSERTPQPVQELVPQEPAPDVFRAFFEMFDGPVALCDRHLDVLAANPAFEALCGVRSAMGCRLSELLDASALEAPNEGESRELEVQCRTGQVVTVSLTRRVGTVAVMAKNLSAVARSSPEAAGRALMEQARVQQMLLEVGRNVVGAVSEEELVAVVARGVKGLFPGRTFCVRIIDQRTCALTSLYAEGRMREGARDVVVLKRSAAEKTHLITQILPRDRVRVSEDDVPLMFVGSVRSICAPLVASGHLFGVINVEYPEGVTADLAADDRILIQLANQVAVGVRNAKLIDELTFVRKYLEELLENANALILVVNRERRVVVFNKLLSTLTGRSKQEVLGRDLLDLIRDADRMRVSRILAASLKGERVSNFEATLLGKEGREVRVSLATSSVLTAQNEVEGVIAIGQDLTMMRELERRVIQAEKLASLGKLAASVVHEINNPLTAVASYADALLTRSLGQPAADPADSEKYRKILENCDRVLRFTRDLVSYVRPAQDKPEPVDVKAALEMAVGFCDHVLHKHGVRVERDYRAVPQIAAVRSNLVQVFVNLITNACHAMEPGGMVKLSTRQESGDVIISVQDAGTGIDPKHLQHIFEPFYTTKPEGKGTGLGLSIVQGIVENHGGAIQVQTQLGQGTTFIIRLPIS